MDLCPFCGLPFEEEVIKGKVHHFDVCQSDCIILMHQLRAVIWMKSQDIVRCNVCFKKMSTTRFVPHLEKSHHQAIAIFQYLTKVMKTATDSTIIACPMCGSKFPAWSRLDHISIFHSDTMSMIEQVSDTLKTSYELNIPVMESCVFCGCEYLKEKARSHLHVCQGESIVLVKQLSDRVKAAGRNENNLFFVDRCKACGDRFPNTELVNHIAEVHPTTMYVVQELIKEVKSAPDEGFKKCNLCGRLFLTNKLYDHYDQCHPGCSSICSQIAKNLHSHDFNGNFDCAILNSQSSGKSFLSNNTLTLVEGVLKAIGEIDKKKTLLNKPKNNPEEYGRGETVKANVDKTQRFVEGEVNVIASDDITFEKSKDLQPLGKPKRDSESSFKRRVEKQVGVTSVRENKKPKLEESDDKQLCVRLERLSSHLYQEWMTFGCIVLQEDNNNELMANLQANTEVDLLDNGLKTISENFNLEKPYPELFNQDKVSIEFTSANNDGSYKPVENEAVSALDTLKYSNPYVKLERLTSRFIQEHINPGYLGDLEERNNFVQTLLDDMNETIAISIDFMENFKNSLNLSMNSTSHFKSSTSLSNTSLLGITNLKKQSKTANTIPSENLSIKVIEKAQKIEKKKGILYFQKRLKHFVLKQQEIPPNVKAKLIDARKYVSESKSSKKLLHELLSIKNQKVRNAVRFLLKKLLFAVE